MKTKIESIQRPSHIESTQQVKHTTSLCRETYLFSSFLSSSFSSFALYALTLLCAPASLRSRFFALLLLCDLFRFFFAFTSNLACSCFFALPLFCAPIFLALPLFCAPAFLRYRFFACQPLCAPTFLHPSSMCSLLLVRGLSQNFTTSLPFFHFQSTI